MSSTNNIKKVVKRMEEQAKKQAEEKLKKAAPKIAETFGKKLDSELHNIYNSVIAEFYASYTPTFYKRNTTEGLMTMFKTSLQHGIFSADFDETQLSYRNGYSGEDGLYQTVFREGWHGGAKIDDGMLVPVRYSKGHAEAYDGETVNSWSNAKWQSPYENRTAKWLPARKAPISPLENFYKKKEVYEKGQMENDFLTIYYKEMNRVK